jgi:hypothetical protein
MVTSAMMTTGMTIGPVQVIVFGFEGTDKFQGEVLEELATLRGRGLIRLIDLMVAAKDSDGAITKAEVSGLSEEESAEFGRVLSKLLGSAGAGVRGDEPRDSAIIEDLAQLAVEQTMGAAYASFGLDGRGLRQAMEGLQPGQAVGVLMFEHTWAIPLAAAIRRAGGVPIAQGFVTPEALVIVGAELKAIAEAANAIEVAEIVKSAALLDTLAAVPEAQAATPVVKTAIAADVVRQLVVAGVLEEDAAPEAIETLAAAGLLQPDLVDAAVQLDEQEVAEYRQALAGASHG